MSLCAITAPGTLSHTAVQKPRLRDGENILPCLHQNRQDYHIRGGVHLSPKQHIHGGFPNQHGAAVCVLIPWSSRLGTCSCQRCQPWPLWWLSLPGKKQDVDWSWNPTVLHQRNTASSHSSWDLFFLFSPLFVFLFLQKIGTRTWSTEAHMFSSLSVCFFLWGVIYLFLMWLFCLFSDVIYSCATIDLVLRFLCKLSKHPLWCKQPGSLFGTFTSLK